MALNKYLHIIIGLTALSGVSYAAEDPLALPVVTVVYLTAKPPVGLDNSSGIIDPAMVERDVYLLTINNDLKALAITKNEFRSKLTP